MIFVPDSRTSYIRATSYLRAASRPRVNRPSLQSTEPKPTHPFTTRLLFRGLMKKRNVQIFIWFFVIQKQFKQLNDDYLIQIYNFPRVITSVDGPQWGSPSPPSWGCCIDLVAATAMTERKVLGSQIAMLANTLVFNWMWQRCRASFMCQAS